VCVVLELMAVLSIGPKRVAVEWRLRECAGQQLANMDIWGSKPWRSGEVGEIA
jgi:hypothetical protein